MTVPISEGYREESVNEAAVSWGQLQGQRSQSAHKPASLLTPTASSGGALELDNSLQRRKDTDEDQSYD